MSMFLIFCVLAAAGWLLLSVTNRDSSDRPDASVEAYSRAMAALSPQQGHHRASHRPGPRRPARRPPARATRPRPRTVVTAQRRPVPAPRTTTRR